MWLANGKIAIRWVNKSFTWKKTTNVNRVISVMRTNHADWNRAACTSERYMTYKTRLVHSSCFSLCRVYGMTEMVCVARYKKWDMFSWSEHGPLKIAWKERYGARARHRPRGARDALAPDALRHRVSGATKIYTEQNWTYSYNTYVLRKCNMACHALRCLQHRKIL